MAKEDVANDAQEPVSLKAWLVAAARNVSWLALAVLLTIVAHSLLKASHSDTEQPTIDEISHRVQYELGHAIASGQMREFELGEFTTTTHRTDINTTLRINLHVSLVVQAEDVSRFERRYDSGKHRLRDRTLAVINNLPTQDLVDPKLRELKAAIAEEVNEYYGQPIVVTATFSNFSLVDQF